MSYLKLTILLLLISASTIYAQTTLKGLNTRLGKTEFSLTLPRSFKLKKKHGMDYQAFELRSNDLAIIGHIYIGNFPSDIVADPKCKTEYIKDTIFNQKTIWLIDKCDLEFSGRVRIDLEEMEKMQFFVKAKDDKNLRIFISIIESLKRK